MNSPVSIQLPIANKHKEHLGKGLIQLGQHNGLDFSGAPRVNGNGDSGFLGVGVMGWLQYVHLILSWVIFVRSPPSFFL